MNRLGFGLQDFQKAYTLLKNNKHVKNIYLMSHFSHSEMENVPVTAEQTQRFERAVQGLAEESSLANSAGILAWPQTHKAWIRPGIALYGVSPFPNRSAAQHSLLPVMTLKSEIIAINNVNKGETIGYGGVWSCPENMRIGVVAAGYGDGYPRNAPSGMPVLLNEKLVELVGRVSMDMLTLDLRSQPDAQVGDSVTLWGDGLPLEEVAESAFISPYELLCGVNRGELLRTKIEDKSNVTPY
jgi:alanine racemase